MGNRIFVFGSNLRGVHGAGAALYAMRNHGAVYGAGVGESGNAYAIPTKGYKIETLPLAKIKTYVDQFLEYARDHPELEFDVTPIGCGLAGYRRSQIEPMFADMPSNCHFTSSWDDHHD